MDLPIQWEGWRHHHWLLIRLALKTGDVTRIWSAYGEGGLAGLMGLSEEVHSPDDFRVPQVGWGFSGCTALRFYLIKYSSSSDKVFRKKVTGSSPTRDMHIRLSGTAVNVRYVSCSSTTAAVIGCSMTLTIAVHTKIIWLLILSKVTRCLITS